MTPAYELPLDDLLKLAEHKAATDRQSELIREAREVGQ